jgi:ribokinase
MLFDKEYDIIAIGDTVTDAFIRLKDAKVTCDIDKANCMLSMKFGDKLPFEFVEVVKAVGNSANAAVSAARLGLRVALATDLGDDQNGRECLETLKGNGVSTSLVTMHKGIPTNYHYVLWYEAERTILVKHQEFPYRLPKFKAPKWIYLSSLGGNSYPYHLEIVEYLKRNPSVKLAFQPGTFQMSLGTEKLKALYTRTDVFVCNVEEAQRILSMPKGEIHDLLSKMHALGPKTVLITDGPKGAYMYDGINMKYMPIYPDPKDPYERTGCGDAFASTFVSALALGKTPNEALIWAPINPMQVVQFVGAQKGLLTRPALEAWLAKAPADYKPVQISN